MRDYGKPAADDFIRCGIVDAVNGMESYQTTACLMGREPYALEELNAARTVRDRLIKQCGEHIKSRYGWAREHVGSGKFPNLQKAAGPERWANDYQAASRSVHFDYREMKSLFGMAETKQEVLLCGRSNSGMTEPAHSAAIALVQVTGAFVMCYADSEDSPLDYSMSALMIELLDNLATDAGDRFLVADSAQ